MTSTDSRPEPPLRTWKLQSADGTGRLLVGAMAEVNSTTGVIEIRRWDRRFGMCTAFAINPLPGTSIEDVTEAP